MKEKTQFDEKKSTKTLVKNKKKERKNTRWENWMTE